jgi:spore coat protein U-like protein
MTIRTLFTAALLLLTGGVRSASAASCSAYASSIAFDNYAPSGLVNVTGSVTVTCTRNTVYTVSLNAGLASGATVTNRSMQSASLRLGYALYSDAARTINWGNTSGTNYVTGTGTGSAQPITIYAQIPAGEITSVGSYTDTITASIAGTGVSTVTAQFSVTATEQAGCALSASSLNFGNYSGTLISATSTISVTCTNGTTYNVGLNAGTATGATVTTRKMTGPASAHLSYALYRNSTHTTNWGNTVGTDTTSGTGNGATQSLPVYGQLAAGQSTTNPGIYSDTITATITY